MIILQPLLFLLAYLIVMLGLSPLFARRGANCLVPISVTSAIKYFVIILTLTTIGMELYLFATFYPLSDALLDQFVSNKNWLNFFTFLYFFAFIWVPIFFWQVFRRYRVLKRNLEEKEI